MSIVPWAAASGVLLLAMSAAADGQQPALPSQAQLVDAVRLGTVATLAPLCGVRDESWMRDLRRAVLQSLTGSAADDPSLRAAPGSAAIVAALSHAEAEALEDFADATPDRSCAPLGRDPELGRADSMVDAFRTRALGSGS